MDRFEPGPPTGCALPEDRRFKAVFDQTAVGVAVINTDSGSFSSANARFREIAGLTPADLPRTLAQDLTHPDDREREARQARALREGRILSYTLETRYLRADGSIAWVKASVSPMWAPGEPPTQHLSLVEDITERKRAEEALRASEARYRMLWQTTTDAVVVIDGEGIIQYANPAVRQVFGHDPDSLLGSSIAVLQPVAARDLHSRGMQRYLKTGTRTLDWRSAEVNGLRADGSEVPLEVSFSHADIDGHPMLAGFLRDISARKATEASLGEWKNRYEATIHASGQVLYDWNTVTNVVNYGGDLERFTGYTRAEMGGCRLTHWIDMIHEEDRAAFQSEIARVIAQRAPFHLEYRLRRKDGEYVTVQDDGHFVRDASGQTNRMVGFVGDISERKRADDALRISEERLKLAVSAGCLGTWDWTMQNDGMEWSALSKEMFGFAADEHIDYDKFIARLHPDDREVTARAVVVTLKEQKDYKVELRIIWPDGSVHWIEALGRGLFDDQGRAHRMTGVVLDITERKRAEHQRQLLESHVRESQKMEAIGTLAGGIAHDFNNILAAILGNVAMAQDDIGASHRAFESLAQVRKAAMRARTLVQQILTFSRREPQELRTQALGPLVEEALALLRSTLPAGVSLVSALSEQPLQIAADGTQIEQVIMNLCTNAWHAVSREGGRIEVGLAPVVLPMGSATRLPSGKYAHLWISDNGCGMDQATRSRIFEPFFTTKEVGQGTGLGLAIVHGIVLAHGGAVAVDSEPGKGSSFHVYLPLHEGLPSATPLPVTAIDSQLRGQGQRVLYIDDDDVMVLMVGRLLERIGYEVTCIQDSTRALALLREQPPVYDIVVTDFNMPGLSGLDIAREMRRLHPGTPVIISSGGVSPELRERAAEQGVAAVLEKQNTLEELAVLLQSVLSAVPSTLSRA